MTRKRLMSVAIAVLVLAAAIIAALIGGNAVVPTPPAEASIAGDRGDFHIAGSVGGLFPGDKVNLTLRVQNPFDVTILVTGLRAEVGRAAPGCRGRFVRIRRYSGNRRVGAQAFAPFTLVLKMSRNASDACQGQWFPITFTGRAVQA